MSCSKEESWIHGYLDGELDLARSLEVESHMKDCTACAQAYDAYVSLRSAISRSPLHFEAPDKLKKRIRSMVRSASRAEAGAFGMRWGWRVVWIPIAAACLVFLGALPFLLRPEPQILLSQEIVSAHVRSLMPGHLTDVVSSDQHTVKPWFNGKLDFSPPVTDLASQGFPMVGGRMDYIDNRAVAALVYQRRKHLINLFIWPSPPAAGSSEEVLTQNGYHVIRWSQSGMTYWAVSDVSEADLHQFVNAIAHPSVPNPRP